MSKIQNLNQTTLMLYSDNPSLPLTGRRAGWQGTEAGKYKNGLVTCVNALQMD
jgi:hypothetical protein